jgi:hypothetical protein
VLFRQVGLSKVLRWAHLGLLDTQQVITMKVRRVAIAQQAAVVGGGSSSSSSRTLQAQSAQPLVTLNQAVLCCVDAVCQQLQQWRQDAGWSASMSAWGSSMCCAMLERGDAALLCRTCATLAV